MKLMKDEDLGEDGEDPEEGEVDEADEDNYERELAKSLKD
jgi:hypothetical protein